MFDQRACAGMQYLIKGRAYTIPNLTFIEPQYMLSTSYLDGLYDLLKVVTELCTARNIILFATSGTLLSAIRHGTFMPWDDDIDMGYLHEDHAKIGTLFGDLFLRGYRLIECTPGFVIQHFFRPMIAMDLFSFAPYGDDTYRYAMPFQDARPSFMISKLFPKDSLMADELFHNLERVMIADIQVWVPKNAHDVLKRQYSPTVLTEVRGVVSNKSHILRPLQILLPIAEYMLPMALKYELSKIALT